MGLKATQFESVLGAVPDALVGMDQKGAIRFVNRQTELLFGHDREQLIGQHISVLVPEGLWPIDDQHRDDFFADPQSRFVGVDLELSGRHHDGGEFPINVRLSYIDTGDVMLAITAVADVTRRKQAVVNAELLDAIVRYSNEAIMGADLNGIITSWNPAAERLYGYSSLEAIGKDASLLMPKDRAGDEGALLAKPKDDSAVENLETSRVRKDGTSVTVSVTVAPIHDENGVIVGESWVHRDVTEQKRARETAQRMAAIVEGSDDAIISRGNEGTITSWNPGAERMLGYSSEEMIGRSAGVLVPEDRLGELDALVKQVGAGSRIGHLETVRLRKDGTSVPVSLTISPIYGEGGVLVGAATIARDVTGQRQALETAQRMAAIVESSADAIIGETLQGIITSWNPAAARMFGYSGAEIIGKPVDLLIPEDRKGDAEAAVATLSAGRSVHNLETVRVRKDGTVFPISLTISPLRDADGGIVGASAIYRDLTELEQSAHYARSLIEATMDPLVTISPEGKVTDVNEATVKVTGVPRDQLIGSDFSGYFTNPGKAHEGYQKAFTEGSVTGYPLTLRHRDGTLTDVLYNASVYRDPSGNVLGVFAAARDVTEQRRAFEAAQRMTAIVESSADAIIGETLEGVITSWNPAATAMFGYSREEIIGKPVDLLIPEDQAGEAKAVVARISAGQHVEHLETFNVRKDGTVFPILLTVSPIRDADGAVVGASVICRDTTEQVQAAKVLATTSRQYRLLAENASDLVVMTSLDRVITWVSPSLTRSLGWAVEDLMGKRLLDLVHPDDAAATAAPREALVPGHEVSTPAGGFLMRLRSKAGQYRWMAGVATPVTDESGVITDVVSGLRDVDDLVRAREEAQADRATLRATLDSLMDPHILFAAVRDESGQIVDFVYVEANPAACAYLGIDHQNLVGARLLDLQPRNAGPGPLEQYRRVVETGEPLVLDDIVYVQELMGDQERRYDVRAARVRDGISITWRDVTHRYATATAEALQVADQQLQELMIKLSRAHEEEREHLSRELHDNLGQILTSASLFAKAASLDIPPERRELHDRVRSLIDEALASTRSLAWTLRRSEKSQELEGRLKRLVDDVSSRESTEVNLEFRGHGQSVSVGVESVAFRIVQEAITNVLRHAHARHAWIIVTLTGDQVGVVVKDDGIGFDAQSTATRMNRAGLRGMEERAHSLGGTLKIDSRPGWGTTVQFDLSSFEANAYEANT